MAYATYDQLKVMYPGTREVPNATAAEIMEYASNFIDSEVRAKGNDPDLIDEDIMRQVCCTVAKRIIGTNPTVGDVSQMSMTVGSVSEQFTFANPDGSVFLYKSEKRLLGISGGCIGFAQIGGAR